MNLKLNELGTLVSKKLIWILQNGEKHLLANLNAYKSRSTCKKVIFFIEFSKKIIKTLMLFSL